MEATGIIREITEFWRLFKYCLFFEKYERGKLYFLIFFYIRSRKEKPFFRLLLNPVKPSNLSTHDPLTNFLPLGN
jgi:hypothetical protein